MNGKQKGAFDQTQNYGLGLAAHYLVEVAGPLYTDSQLPFLSFDPQTPVATA